MSHKTILAALAAVFLLSLTALLPHAAAALPPGALDLWRTVASPTTNSLNGIACSNGLYVAVGNRGAILTSPDGVTWTAGASGVTNHLRSITYDQDRWVACGDSVVLQSPDAVNWTDVPLAGLPVGGQVFASVRYGLGRFVALGATGVAFSTNGLNWNYQSTASPQLESLTFGVGKFYGVRGDFLTGSEIISSTNGLDWLLVTNFGNYLNLDGITYAGERLIAMGANGYTVTSDNGTNWTQFLAVPTCATQCQKVWDVAFGDGTWLLVSDYEFRHAASPPPVTWTGVVPTPCFSKQLTYGPGGFVAVGGNGCISVPARVYWTNTLGGNWGNAANWQPNRVPKTNDHALIKAGGTYTVSIGSDAVHNLTVGGSSGTQTVIVGGNGFVDASFYGANMFASNTILNFAGSIHTTVYGDGRITIHGQMNQTGSAIFVETIAMMIATNATLNLSGSFHEFRGVITNSGTIIWSGAGDLVVGYGFSLHNLASGVVDIQNAQVMTWSTIGGAAVFNAGLFRKSAGSGTTILSDVGLFNTGMVEVRSGTLQFNNSGLIQQSGSTVLDGGHLSFHQSTAPFGAPPRLMIRGGLLGGSGNIGVHGTLISMSGQISPGLSAGRLEVQGNYTQPSPGAYNVEIGGTIAGTNYDQVVVASNATLAGTINVVAINGFTPAPGDRFEIMKFGSRSGTVVFNGLDIANGVTLVPEFSSTNLVLVATSAPLNAPPRMNLARNGSDLWVWWPQGYGTFNVQSTTNLNPPITWSPVSPAEANRHILTADGPATFFRLVAP